MRERKIEIKKGGEKGRKRYTDKKGEVEEIGSELINVKEKRYREAKIKRKSEIDRAPWLNKHAEHDAWISIYA